MNIQEDASSSVISTFRHQRMRVLFSRLHVAGKSIDALLCCGSWSWQEEITSLDSRNRFNEGNSGDLVTPKGKGLASLGEVVCRPE